MEQLLKFIDNLNSAQRAVIIGGVSLLFVLLLGFLVYSNVKAEDRKLNYTIATNLTKSQVMLAGDELEAAGIKFSVVGTGNNLTLKTSKEFVNIAKIKLVTSEAATSKHVGWEIFEKSSLGTTNFENKVKYLRALEGELSRSLESLSGVLRASVKIAIPKDTIFTERKANVTASAMIALRPGLFLTQKQIEGIKNFIASAVSDLKNENIQLIDQDGNLLQKSPEDMDNLRSFTQNKYKNKIEEAYERKIVELLEPFVGAGRVVAKVSIALDFVKQNIEEEIYDPEGTIRAQQIIENTSSSKGKSPSKGGVAGASNNIQNPSGSSGAGDISSNNEGTNTVTNYEISKKIIKQKDNNYSRIKRITAGVTFDSSILKDVQNKAEFLSSIESVVQDTIGYDKKRGDKITVKDFKFIDATRVNEKGQIVDASGKVISQGSEDGSVDTLAMIKSILTEFSDYLKYLFAAILLFIFYKKFIVNHEVVILGKDGEEVTNLDDDAIRDEILSDLEGGFSEKSAKTRLKSKIRSQILNNIEGLDEEAIAKYEVLIEELDKEINNHPEELATMIELLLSEGDSKFK